MFWCCYSHANHVSDEPDNEEVTISDLSQGGVQRTCDAVEQLSPVVEVAERVEDAKAEESDEEDAADGTFNVTLHMTPGERLGALLDILDMKTLRVAEVRLEGRLRIHNLRATDNRKVLAGYHIVGVNGKSGKAEAMVDEMRRSRTWRLKVARKHEFTVTLEKTGHLCLDLQFEKESDCIVIRKVGEGVVHAYNERAEDADQKVRNGDRIVNVNGVAGPAKTMLQTIKENTDLTFKIARPALKPEQKAQAAAPLAPEAAEEKVEPAASEAVTLAAAAAGGA